MCDVCMCCVYITLCRAQSKGDKVEERGGEEGEGEGEGEQQEDMTAGRFGRAPLKHPVQHLSTTEIK